jgi:5-methylcytosine-specific restriction endonuclease McrA
MLHSPWSQALSSSVLVLNRSYAAVRVVTVRRAFVMLFREAAEVVHIENGGYANYDFRTWCDLSRFWGEEAGCAGETDEWVQAVNQRIHSPRIIRLLRFDQAPRLGLRLNRRSLFARDRDCCQYCGRDFPHSQLSLDHVTPRSRGGRTTWENVVTCCLGCNARKGDRTPQEAGMRLRARPIRPKENPVLSLKLGHPQYQSWRPFLIASLAIEVA